MAERILDRPTTIAVELVGYWHQTLRSASTARRKNGVRVRDVEENGYGRSAERPRAAISHLRKLVSKHDR